MDGRRLKAQESFPGMRVWERECRDDREKMGSEVLEGEGGCWRGGMEGLRQTERQSNFEKHDGVIAP